MLLLLAQKHLFSTRAFPKNRTKATIPNPEQPISTAISRLIIGFGVYDLIKHSPPKFQQIYSLYFQVPLFRDILSSFHLSSFTSRAQRSGWHSIPNFPFTNNLSNPENSIIGLEILLPFFHLKKGYISRLPNRAILSSLGAHRSRLFLQHLEIMSH